MKRPPYSEPEPEGSDTVKGVRVAKVRSNQDPENLGRVKLAFPWRDADDESYWARIATEMTGADYGTYFLPEVGDEVLVGFENGDIHHPVVIGSLYSGQRKPPENNADGSNDIRKIETRGGHVVEFDDGDDGKVTIETDAGHEIVLDDESGSESVTIEDKSGNTVEMDAAENTISLSADKEVSLEAPTISLSADTKVDISSDGKVEISGKGKTNVSSKGQLNLESNGLMGISANGMLTIEGTLIRLN